ncbi:MAG: diguanylate cyclase [Gammaproteobacteria bacterium]
MIELDPNTLLVAAFAVTLCCAMAMGLFWATHRHDRAIGYCALALTSTAVGIIVLTSQRGGHDVIPIVIANVALNLGTLLTLSGLRLFAGQKPLSKYVVIAILSVTAICYYYWTVIEPALTARLAYNAGLAGIACVLGAYSCLLCGPSGERARITLGWLTIVHGLFVVGAVSWLMLNQRPDTSLLDYPGFLALRSMEAIFTNVFFVVLTVQVVADRLRQRVAKEAITDPLTGLLNRRGLEAAAHRELLRRDEQNCIVGVCSADIDRFKLINDEYGHQAGDAVIAQVAREIQRVLRPAEVLGRMGGEEFCMVLRIPNAEVALNILERVRVAIEALDVRTKTGQRIDFTISIGYTCADTRQIKITEITTAAFAFERLFGVADRALYTAKNSGRNCVATSEISDLARAGDPPTGTNVPPNTRPIGATS